MEAQSLRLHGRLERDPQRLAAAAQLFADTGIRFWQAVTQVEHAELVGGAEGDRLRAAARATFERLGATAWLDRADEPLAAAIGD